MTRAWVVLLCACSAHGRIFVFDVPAPGEVVAELEMSSPNSDWAIEGREASVALLRTAGRPDHHVMLYAGAKRQTYRVFWGISNLDVMNSRWTAMHSADIEYVYRLESNGRATVQGRGHKNVPYSGGFDGAHPLLTPVTSNNMVEGNAPTPLRFQLAPKLIGLEGHLCEAAMDDEPVTYEVMRKELIREGRLRPFGIVDGDKISDPFNYFVVECKLALRDGKVAVLVRRSGERRWYGSHQGRSDYAIDRSGWVRAEIGFECLEGSHYRGTPEPCVVEQVGRVFFPGQNPIRVRGTPVSLAAGEMAGLIVE